MSISSRPAGILILALAAVFACFTGCTSPSAQRSDPAKQPRKLKQVVTRAGNQVSIQWDAAPGTNYAILYSPNLNDPTSWRVLVGHDRIQTAGGQHVVSFEAPAPGTLYYRVRAVISGPR
jgi:hypothetical protein